MEIDWLHATPQFIAMQLHLQKQASLLIWRQHRGELSTQAVRAEIERAPEAERESLREWCNHYRRLAGLKGAGRDAG